MLNQHDISNEFLLTEAPAFMNRRMMRNVVSDPGSLRGCNKDDSSGQQPIRSARYSQDKHVSTDVPAFLLKGDS